MELPKKEKQEELPANKKEELLDTPKEEEKIWHEERKLLPHQKIDELTNDLKRVQAEFQNYKKRVDKEREEMTKIATANIIRQLLTIIDELEIALQHVKDKGIEMVYANLLSLLKSYGLREMENKTFDPYKHEAVKQIEGEEDGKIVEVLKKGYMLNDMVLRHALVVVSKKR